MCGHNSIWELRILAARGRRSQSRCPCVVVRAIANGGQVSGLWSREAMKHVCGVGFIKRSFDLHRFKRGGTDCLGCDLRHSDKTATVIRGSCVMPWGSDLKTSRGTVDLCYACMNLLYCVKIFV